MPHVSFLLRDLLVVSLLKDPLAVSKLILHLLSDVFQSLLVLKSDLLLKQVSFLSKLSLQLLLLILEHLSEPSLHQVPVIVELLFPLLSQLFMSE